MGEIAFPNGIRPAKRLRITARHLARREENFDIQQLLAEQFDNGLIYFKHDFTDKTQIAHTFLLFRPLGVFVWRRLLALWGYWVGELVDCGVFCQRQ